MFNIFKRRDLRSVFMSVLVFLLAACSSPEERVEKYTASGEKLFSKGEHIQANIQFRNALQINPDHAPALRGMLRVAEAKENPAPRHARKIAGILQKIVSIDESDVGARVKLAKFMLLQEAIDKAVDLSDEALSIDPKNPDALAMAAGVKLKLEDYAGAIKYATSAVAMKQDIIDAYVVLAAERVIAEDIPGAIQHLDAGMAAGSDALSLQLIKIQMLERMQDVDGVIAIYERLIALQPDERALSRAYGFFLARHERFEEARSVFKDLTTKDALNDLAALDYARFLNTLDGAGAAEAFLQKIIVNDPSRLALRQFLAELKISNGERDRAYAILHDMTEYAPDTALGVQAKARLAQLAFEDGNRETAERYIAEALEIDSRQMETLVLKASIAMKDRRLDDAIAGLRTVLSDAPESATALMMLGRAHELAGSTDLADDRYLRAAQVSNAAPLPSLTYVQFLLRRARWEQAEEILGAVLSRAPNNRDAWRALAQVRLQRQDWIGAQQAADQLRAMNEDSQITNQIEGTALQGLQRHNESLDAFKRAHEAAPARARPLAALIRAYVRAGRQEDARRFLENFVETNEGTTLASVLLAQLWDMNGESGKAEQVLIAAREASPQSALPHHSLYRFYVAKKRFDEAGVAISAGLQAHPQDRAMRLLEANYLELIEDYDGAIARYEAMLIESPNSELATNNLASLLSEHREDEESLQRARRMAERFRDSPVPHFRDTLGWAYFRLGDTDQAVDILEGVVEQSPEFALFRYHLGMGYLEGGDNIAAKSELEKALNISDALPSSIADSVQKTLEGL